MAPSGDVRSRSYLTIALLTLNCANREVNTTLLGADLRKSIATDLSDNGNPDLIVISAQEFTYFPYAFIGGQHIRSKLETLATIAHCAFPEDQYSPVFSENVGTTGLIILLRDDVEERIASVESSAVGLGPIGLAAKGAIGAALTIRQTTESSRRSGDSIGELLEGSEELELIFVAAHLAAFETEYPRRNLDWRAIVKNLVFDGRRSAQRDTTSLKSVDSGAEDAPLISSTSPASMLLGTIYHPSSHAFVLGDLNYRTSDAGPEPDSWQSFPQVEALLSSTDQWTRLLERDQLTRERRRANTLHGFDEHAITFPPTYKYALRAKSSSDSSSDMTRPWARNRWPSWCDRILFRSSTVEPLRYSSLPLRPNSDHQPVMLLLRLPFDASSRDDQDLQTFTPNEQHALQRAAVRRLEFVVGCLAWLGLTEEGRITLAISVMGVVVSLLVKSGVSLGFIG